MDGRHIFYRSLLLLKREICCKCIKANVTIDKWPVFSVIILEEQFFSLENECCYSGEGEKAAEPQQF